MSCAAPGTTGWTRCWAPSSARSASTAPTRSSAAGPAAPLIAALRERRAWTQRGAPSPRRPVRRPPLRRTSLVREPPPLAGAALPARGQTPPPPRCLGKSSCLRTFLRLSLLNCLWGRLLKSRSWGSQWGSSQVSAARSAASVASKPRFPLHGHDSPGLLMGIGLDKGLPPAPRLGMAICDFESGGGGGRDAAPDTHTHTHTPKSSAVKFKSSTASTLPPISVWCGWPLSLQSCPPYCPEYNS